MQQRIQSWLDGPFDEKTKLEICRLQKEDPKALQDAFFQTISFGTGGMRALMGVGTNRLNVYTIRMATQGLANYLKKGSVFIGYDVRHNSRLFAEEAAKVLAGNGIKALISKEICPTPLVSFACRYFVCSAAIMITASHNPPAYNGYKVYGKDGCQVVSPEDAGIMNEVKKITDLSQVKLKDEFHEIGDEIDLAYLAELKKIRAPTQSDLQIVYTNLHGTGIRLLPKALESLGYTHLSFVEEQRSLDGSFPHAPSPNPEEPKALALGLEQLNKQNADLLIATDPDADRIGIATQEGLLTGNQIACICLEHLCTSHKLPPKSACIKTIVTTELFRSIAERHGVACIDVLTGFKYIGEKIGEWERTKEHHFLFGAEESYGYLDHTFARDKDAISTACLIAEIAAKAKQRGKTLQDLLKDIYRKYGAHQEALHSFSFGSSQKDLETMQHMMKALKTNLPTHIGNTPITTTEDYSNGLHNLPPSNVLRFWLKDKSKLVIRPSGTEPKIKLYAEVTGAATEDLKTKLASLIQSASDLFQNL